MLSKTTQKVYATKLESNGWVKYLAKGPASVMWASKIKPEASNVLAPTNGKFVKCIDTGSLKKVLETRKQDMWVLKLGRLTVMKESH